MTEIITTAAELDALPVGSIVIDAFAAACVKARESKPSMPSDWVRVTPAVRGGEHHHRPFVPAVAIRIGLDDPHQPVTTQPTVKPSREWLSEALMQIYDHGTLPNALREADALLNLWPGRTEALNVLAEKIHDIAVAHGFWDADRNFGEMIALAHSELSEALEEHRDGKPNEYYRGKTPIDGAVIDYSKPEGVAVELADCLIRILDTMHSLGVDIDGVVARKMAYNATRPLKHGKAY